ncbi:MAG TPA: choice-of-anchor Q domain-containing protein [Candidatus Acidoferrum sp.]|nr:choice-of-anchor Q domain-containing protein [Candidatus Acidoferrum sp.]
MKRNIACVLFTLVVVVGASLAYSDRAWSASFDVDRTDDNAAATACTLAPNDCSLRGAIIAANADLSGTPVVINLQPGTTYSLTLTNANQENAAATGDLDITTALHTVTIVGGGSSGPNATIIDAAGLNTGSFRDRVFHVTGAGITLVLQDLVVQGGMAADDGTSGASTDPTALNNVNRAGGCILNNGGSVTLTNVVVRSCVAVGKGDTVINQHTTLDALGGGLASLGATGAVIVTDSVLTGNTASGGNGGNFNNGAGSNAKGGSIYFEGGTLNMTGSRIEASAANGGNGGNQNQDGQTNGGFGGLAQGGGAWIGGGTATISTTTFENTVATGGNSGTGGNGANPAGDAAGGGLYSLGNVTVSSSTFHLAAANGGQGGDAFGTTCLGGHQAGDGGGARGGAIFADGGSLIVNTVTFANNFAMGGSGGDGGQTDGGLNCGNHGAGGLAHGGAITNNNAATVNIKHATISANNAQAGNTGVNQGGANKPPRPVAEGTGGGIRVGPGGVTLENTIIAGNTAANGTGDATGAPIPGPDVDGAVTSNGHNLLGVATEATGFTGTGDLIGANPMLAPLADNGGPTKTMELLPGSAAIDAGVAAGASFDQRGKARTFDDAGVGNAATSDGTDIGAFERHPNCALACPANLSLSNTPGQCGAVVNYPSPTPTGFCGTVTCAPSGVFAVGETTVTCTSSVGPTCNFKVTVNDTQGPTITTNNQPIALWPPNHKYATVKVTDLVTSASDNCDPGVGVGGVRIAQVTSDEPNNSGGDGNTTNDIVIAADCKSVQLRAERMGTGNGRVYTITFKATDAAANVSTATAKVTVPHSQNGAPAPDDGPAYTVVSSCQ